MEILWSPLLVLIYIIVGITALSGYLRNGADGVVENLTWLVTPKKKAPKADVAAAAPAAPVTVAGPHKTTYRQKYQTSHGGHAIATVFTLGMWAPMWALFTVANKVHPGRRVTERHHY